MLSVTIDAKPRRVNALQAFGLESNHCIILPSHAISAVLWSWLEKNRMFPNMKASHSHMTLL